jgi:ribosomal protein L2
LAGKAERKKPVGRHRYRWKGININFVDLEWGGGRGREWTNQPTEWYQW